MYNDNDINNILLANVFPRAALARSGLFVAKKLAHNITFCVRAIAPIFHERLGAFLLFSSL